MPKHPFRGIVMSNEKALTIDGQTVSYQEGQAIMDAAMAAGIYIPHLCHKFGFTPCGSCRVCTVKVNGRHAAACTTPAADGQQVINDDKQTNALRHNLVQMLFVEGNHVCPSCEKSGNCQLQAVAYALRMLSPRFPHFYPRRLIDASHPDALIDYNRCILCQLCVRASRDVDGKNVFAVSGRGLQTHLVVNAASGKLRDTDFDLQDQAAHVCPVGAIVIKHRGFEVPIGQRRYDDRPIGALGQPSAPTRGQANA